MAVTAGRTTCFSVVVVTVGQHGPGDGGGGVGKAVAWSRRWRRSGTTWFPSAVVKVGRTTRFSGAATVWRQSEWL
jgi:hypothetical protein